MIAPDAARLYFDLQPAYRESLVAPQDDMWAAFADAADHHALRVSGETAGCCSLNTERELLFFHVGVRHERRAEEVFRHALDRLQPIAAIPSTVDPVFLSLSLEAGHSPSTKAILFEHLREPEGSALTDLRVAESTDHAAATAFFDAALEMPRSFLVPYLVERIEKRELILHENGGRIIACGECRADTRRPGHAHLGLVVDSGRRGKGLGSRLMHALVLESRRRDLKPLCSTEPSNAAARQVIEKAGFRARHRMVRVALGGS